jgi:hypothetical protein
MYFTGANAEFFRKGGLPLHVSMVSKGCNYEYYFCKGEFLSQNTFTLFEGRWIFSGSLYSTTPFLNEIVS